MFLAVSFASHLLAMKWLRLHPALQAVSCEISLNMNKLRETGTDNSILYIFYLFHLIDFFSLSKPLFYSIAPQTPIITMHDTCVQEDRGFSWPPLLAC